MEHSSGAFKTACSIFHQPQKLMEGRGVKEVQDDMEDDCHEWKPRTVSTQERNPWRSDVRSAILTASQLPGRGPTDVDDAPAL